MLTILTCIMCFAYCYETWWLTSSAINPVAHIYFMLNSGSLDHQTITKYDIYQKTFAGCLALMSNHNYFHKDIQHIQNQVINSNVIENLTLDNVWWISHLSIAPQDQQIRNQIIYFEQNSIVPILVNHYIKETAKEEIPQRRNTSGLCSPI